jgi:hypothetical protein
MSGLNQEVWSDIIRNYSEYQRSFGSVKKKDKGGSIGDELIVNYSSWFDTNVYDTDTMISALKSIGAEDIYTDNDRGWSNQPRVVVFSGVSKRKAEDKLNEVFDTQWVSVGIKDWQNFEYADYKKDKGGLIKGRNNKTGESFGVVIGSKQKADEYIEDGVSVNVRQGYGSRITEYKMIFDKNNNLFEVIDYGSAIDGEYPSTSSGSGKSVNAVTKSETIGAFVGMGFNRSFAMKVIDFVR